MSVNNEVVISMAKVVVKSKNEEVVMVSTHEVNRILIPTDEIFATVEVLLPRVEIIDRADANPWSARDGTSSKKSNLSAFDIFTFLRVF